MRKHFAEVTRYAVYSNHCGPLNYISVIIFISVSIYLVEFDKKLISARTRGIVYRVHIRFPDVFPGFHLRK